ncbi:MAG TPA: Re/Si-specific NAD(P)(+) transhydrogenase subunit alpha [Dongiaceae bacterium]|nr:Re/Si-specific NAD(P)(+) transhydrogenase subunit alpha [Dongiaceae bacterium]
MLTIGVPRETIPGENRVAVIPETAGKLVQAGHQVVVESGAGQAASHTDQAYRDVKATVAADARAALERADIVVRVREPRPATSGHEADLIREGATLIAFLDPLRNGELLERLAARRVTAFAMEKIPRITRAQRMDALSSMSTVAGYKAALMAADHLGKFFPLLMTAAGTIAPAKVFVLGAGVAGLQAIATSRRLGAVVEAFDVRPAVKEEVQSLGATFVHLDLTNEQLVGAGGYAKAMSAEQEARERELIHQHIKGSDVVISTAIVPGRKAPVLITEAMVRDMRPGSVIVDLAAEMGGNCELTQPGGATRAHGVEILGPVNLAAALPVHASQMYARNVLALLQHLVKDGALALDFDDEITRDTCVTHAGAVRVAGAPAKPVGATPTQVPA